MEGSENSPGGINTREIPSAADEAVTLMETFIDGCIDRETLRKKFMEKFSGDRDVARVYFNRALRRLINADKVIVTKSGGSEVICRSGELTRIIKRWGDLIDALTWRSEQREIDPDVKANGRIIAYLVRRGLLKALAAFLCRGAKVWAYVDDPVDLSLILGALRYVTLRNGGKIPAECRCPDSEITLFVPRWVFLTYMVATIEVKRDDKTYKEYVQKYGLVWPDGFKVYILKLPGGRTVRLKPIPTDCIIEDENPPGTPTLPEPMVPNSSNVLLTPAIFDDETLPLIIRFVRVVD